MSGLKKEALYYERHSGGVKCLLCPVACIIANSKYGFCGARKNENGVLYAMEYGKVTAIALDPIEKKPLYRFKSGTNILSLGGKGCNFRCPFCQNHGISMGDPQTETLLPDAAAQLAENLKSSGNIGIAYTYNEPFINFEFMLDAAKDVRSKGMCNAVITNGYVNVDPLNEILPYIDAFNIDLKAYNSRFYVKIHGHLERVKDVISCAAKNSHVEVTTLVIPGENDKISEIEQMALWIAGIDNEIPLHLTRFFPKYKMTDKPPTDVSTLEALAEAASKHLKHVYIGNVF